MGGKYIPGAVAHHLSLIIHCRCVSLVLLRHEHSGAWAYFWRLRTGSLHFSRVPLLRRELLLAHFLLFLHCLLNLQQQSLHMHEDGKSWPSPSLWVDHGKRLDGTATNDWPLMFPLFLSTTAGGWT